MSCSYMLSIVLNHVLEMFRDSAGLADIRHSAEGGVVEGYCYSIDTEWHF